MRKADRAKTIRLAAAGFMLVAAGAFSLPAHAACDCHPAKAAPAAKQVKAHKKVQHKKPARTLTHRTVTNAPLPHDNYVWEPYERTATYIDFGQRAYNPPPAQSASVYISPPGVVVEIPPPEIIPAPRVERTVMVQPTFVVEESY